MSGIQQLLVASNASFSIQSQVFNYTGSVQSFVVPAGVSSVNVKMWGGAGGGQSLAGAAGGYSFAAIAVTAGETLSVYVGGGGTNGTGNRTGGNGGGSSAVTRSATPLIIAGGGGGASTRAGSGAGGGSSGLSGTSAGIAATGGTQIAAGSAGNGGRLSGSPGSGYNGGNGSFVEGLNGSATWGHGLGGQGGIHTVDCGGGGGGGGYWGGGGGGNDASGDSGAGGSGYVPVGGTTTAGSGSTPANSSDPDRGTAGQGVAFASGNSGKVIISWVVATDPYYSNVSLLLHMDGSNGSTTFTDNSPSPKTVTANGSAQVNTSVVKYGTGSGYFDGSGDYLTVPASSDLTLGTGNFTIEFWLYPLAFGGSIAGAQLFGNVNGSQSGWCFQLGQAPDSMRLTSNLTGTWTDNITVAPGTGPAVNQWTHVALVRSGGNLSIYTNGLVAGFTTAAIGWNFGNGPFFVGRFDDGTYVRDLNGYIDDLRITKGVARYTTNFTPPTAAFPNS